MTHCKVDLWGGCNTWGVDQVCTRLAEVVKSERFCREVGASVQVAIAGKHSDKPRSVREVPSTLDWHHSIIRDNIHIVLKLVLLEHCFVLFLRPHPEHECPPKLFLNNSGVKGKHCRNGVSHVEDVVQAREGKDDGNKVIFRVGLWVEEFCFAAERIG